MADETPVAPVPATKADPMPTQNVFSWNELGKLVNGTIQTIILSGGLVAIYRGVAVTPTAPVPVTPVVAPQSPTPVVPILPPVTNDDFKSAMSDLKTAIESLKLPPKK